MREGGGEEFMQREQGEARERELRDAFLRSLILRALLAFVPGVNAVKKCDVEPAVELFYRNLEAARLFAELVVWGAKASNREESSEAWK